MTRIPPSLWLHHLMLWGVCIVSFGCVRITYHMENTKTGERFCIGPRSKQ